MSITVIQQPNKFTPANNPIIFQVTSSNTYLVNFRCEITKATTDDVIQILMLNPTPDIPDGCYINISRILNNYVKHTIKNYNGNIIDVFDKNLFSYNIKIVERAKYFTVEDGEVIVETDVYENENPLYVFYGELNPISFKNFSNNQYVVHSGSLIKFLTTKPDNTFVNDYSNEGLFFLQEDYENPISIKHSFYNSAGTLINSYSEQLDEEEQSDGKLFRINCSLKLLKVKYPSVAYNTVSYYTVTLIDDSSTPLSVTRTFFVEEFPCHLKPMNIVWVNKFGCLDTYQFVNPTNSLSITKTTLQKNPYKVGADGVYTDFNEDAFNVVDEVLATNPELTIKLNTRILKDEELTWISELLSTKQAWIQVFDDLFVPVLVNDTSFTLTERRYLTEPNVKQFTFKLSSGFIL